MKIKLQVHKHDQIEIFQQNNFIRCCSDLGIEFVSKNEDIRIVHTYGTNVKKDPSIFDHGPVIVIEKFDSANIGHLKELENKNLLALWKIAKFKDYETNFLPRYKGRYHSYLIMKDRSDFKEDLIRTNKKIDKDILSKVQVPNNYAHYTTTKNVLKFDLNVKSNRNFDVHFLGTTMYDACEVDSPISIHRMTCLRKLNSLKHFKKMVNSGRPLGKEEYVRSLFDSKIVISPWGCGELCYRDFEALAAGCILVKPDTSFVETWPNIFINKVTYFPCRVDFEDLEFIVSDILSKWETYNDIRIQNRKIIEEARKPEIIAVRFKNLVEKVLK